MKARLPLVRPDGLPLVATGPAPFGGGPPGLRLVPPLPMVSVVSAVPALAVGFAATLLGAAHGAGVTRPLLLREAPRALELGGGQWPAIAAVAEVVQIELEATADVALRELEARPSARFAVCLGAGWAAHFTALLTVKVGPAAAHRALGALGAASPDLQLGTSGVDAVASALGRWLAATLAAAPRPATPRS